MKAAGLFVVKSIAFAAIFWSLWLFVFRPISNLSSGSTTNSSTGQGQQNDSDALMKKYWEQAAQADQLQAIYAQQQHHTNAALAKQDELLSRWEKVIQKWEKATAQR